jgi:colicin import membrane protein
MPGGTGTEAGSDYASYIQSRLRDAFKMTIAHQSRKPEVVVQMFISRYGKLSSYRILRSSGDKVFEDAVARAIRIAAENFPPPPNRKEFQQGFIFRPEGLEKK